MASDQSPEPKTGVVEGEIELSTFKGQRLKRSLILLLAIAVLSAGGLAIGQSIGAVRNAEALENEIARAQLEQFITDEQALVATAHTVLRLGEERVREAMGDPSACGAVLDDIVAANDRFAAAFFTAADGYIRCGSGAFDRPVYVGAQPTFLAIVDDPQPRADVIFGQVSGENVLVVSKPIAADDQLTGFSSISIRVATLRRMMREERELVGHFALVPLSADGAPVELRSDGAEWQPSGAMVDVPANQNSIIWRDSSATGASFVYAAQAIGDPGAIALAAWSTDTFRSNRDWRLVISAALPLLTWAIASIILFVALDRLVINHLTRLRRAFASVHSGKLGALTEISPRAPVEFQALGAEFDEMSAMLKKRDDELRRALSEEQLLLREVYHRVKNNLQMVVSLLNLQERGLADDQDRALLKQTRDRVQSLAFVHQSLYQIGRLSEARLDVIVEQIVMSIFDTRDPKASGINVELNAISVDADRAIPFALFATEVLTNAQKHGRSDASEYWLTVTLRHKEPGDIVLTVSNLMADAAPKRLDAGRLGSRLMQGFARQLRADCSKEVVGDRFEVRLTCPQAASTIG